MGLFAMLQGLKAMIVNVMRLVKLLLTVKGHSLFKTGKCWSVADLFEEQVDCDPNREQFVQVESGAKTSLRELEVLANQCAHWGMSIGLHASSKDTVAMMMVNSADFVAFWYGMAKIGVKTALINTGSVGIALKHSVETALRNNEGLKMLVISRELYAKLPASIEDDFEEKGVGVCIWEDLYTPTLESYGGGGVMREIGAISTANKTRPAKSIRAHVRESDVLLYIYTSGTTGLPKAGKISHTRYFIAASPFRIMCSLTNEDRIYTALPLYHSSAVMLGVGSAIISGATMVLRKKFSVRAFSEDCSAHNITAVQYIGELCRYLKDAPPAEADSSLSIRIAFGNGLRADVWKGFQRRYGIRHIVEFYAATESNIATFSLDKPGSCGFVPRIANSIYPVKIVRTDPFEPGDPIRDNKTGFCTICGPNEPGLVLGEINDKRADKRFDGYTDLSATQKKVIRDVFRKGDKYFNTGDVLYQDRPGYFYFADRTGDTFRWKGENISTSEVEFALNSMECVGDAAVFGVDVPGYDGKAGMAVLVLSEKTVSARKIARSFSREEWDEFNTCCRSQLAPAARPLFVRFAIDIPKTETFKHRKGPLKEAGFKPLAPEPGQDEEPVFLTARKGEIFPERIDEALYATLQSAKGNNI